MLKGFFTARLHITTVWWWLLESNPHTHTQVVQTDWTKRFQKQSKWVDIIMDGNGKVASHRCRVTRKLIVSQQKSHVFGWLHKEKNTSIYEII